MQQRPKTLDTDNIPSLRARAYGPYAREEYLYLLLRHGLSRSLQGRIEKSQLVTFIRIPLRHPRIIYYRIIKLQHPGSSCAHHITLNCIDQYHLLIPDRDLPRQIVILPSVAGVCDPHVPLLTLLGALLLRAL